MGTAVVSVDLASRRHADVGIAVLDASAGGIRCRIVRAGDRLEDPPDPRVLAVYLARLCDETGAGLLLIDGPQAWKDPHNGLAHQRICEKRLATPGKTGPPGSVKPSSWLGFARFSIDLFDRLDALGWPRARGPDAAPPRAVESFPTAAWRGLGERPLPGKGRATANDVAARTERLTRRFALDLDARPSHDELQALVAGLGGVALARGDAEGFELVGAAPRVVGGVWREGFILNPRGAAERPPDRRPGR